MRKAEDVIKWLYAAEDAGGGIAAWKHPGAGWHKPYPEVTGYLIPTLLAYGQDQLASRCADWLVSIQNPDGSFNGLDGKPRAFDTAAIVEGLRAAGKTAAARKATAWMKTQQLMDGSLRTSPDVEDTEVYNIRAAAIAGIELQYPAWTRNPERTHYLMYTLEGMKIAGHDAEVKIALEMAEKAISPSGLLYAWVAPDYTGGYGTDTCATAQYAMLRGWAALDGSERLLMAVERMIEPNGGVRHDAGDDRQIAWAAKFYLDALITNAQN